ncbi:MAG: DNA-deoxyinosine glycosylase [Mycolicibacterium neoaurum]|uniref:DNA-deoxyinosine glycosylase n=1 Tax=Mycolicibacterium neoaurum TaxID=1795 RepID=UPI002FFA992B
MSDVLNGLAPIIGAHPTVLVLGNMPSVLSLEHRQYYGNPRNAFWRICADIYGLDPAAPYPQRVAALTGHGVAVWDVLKSCRRVGSLDSAIEPASMVANDIGALLSEHPGICRLVFNGKAAERNYRRLVTDAPDLPIVQLPSTSPAHTMGYAEKLRHWRDALG